MIAMTGAIVLTVSTIPMRRRITFCGFDRKDFILLSMSFCFDIVSVLVIYSILKLPLHEGRGSIIHLTEVCILKAFQSSFRL